MTPNYIHKSKYIILDHVIEYESCLHVNRSHEHTHTLLDSHIGKWICFENQFLAFRKEFRS